MKKGFTKWHGYDIKTGKSIKSCPFCNKRTFIKSRESKFIWYLNCSCDPSIVIDWYYDESYMQYLKDGFSKP